MRQDEPNTGLMTALSCASLIFGILGVFWIAWFTVPGLIAGAVPLSRLQGKPKSAKMRAVSLMTVTGCILCAITLIALAVNLTAALSR